MGSIYNYRIFMLVEQVVILVYICWKEEGSRCVLGKGMGNCHSSLILRAYNSSTTSMDDR